MRTAVIACLAAASAAFPLDLIAQESAPRAASTAPPSAASAFIPDRLERIDRWIETLVSREQIPGAVVMLVKDGQVAYHKAWGTREIGKRDPLRPDDIFRIASQTKAITSLAVMMLWEEGRFQLDEPVGKYLPTFGKHTILTSFNPADSTFESKATRRRMTIRQLLTHTSGLDYADIGSEEFRGIYAKAGISALGWEGDVLAERIDKLGTLPLRHEPGERFTYGLSIDVLGRLVEVWSGMPFDRFLRTRIFEPLGMKDTGFDVPAAHRARFVALHRDQDDKLVPWHEPEQGLTHPDAPIGRVTYFSGGGGLVSTTADYARFLQLFLNGGELDGVRLLGRKTVELMLTNQLDEKSLPFGLGFALETEKVDHESPVSLGTFFWSGAFNTWYWADPKEQLVGLIFTNTFGNAPSLGTPFKVLTYSALR